jgi:hypothetical protein
MPVSSNREAYLLLTAIIQRIPLRRVEFLARLAARGHMVNDAALTNWGRAGRAFPRDWVLLRDIVAVLCDGPPATRCTAEEALRFLSLVELPFSELAAVAWHFPSHEFHTALQPYLPDCLVARLNERVRVVGR